MKVHIRIIRDSDNSLPVDEVEFTINTTSVDIRITDEVRVVQVNKQDLIKLLRLLDD